MPRLYLLEGIVIWVNTRDHDPPHFHARFSGEEVRVELATLAVMTGGLTAAKQHLLLKWATVHQAELVRNWELAARVFHTSPSHRRWTRRTEMAHHPIVDVVAVELLGGHRVRLTFDDGHVVERDLSPVLWGPVFERIRDEPAEFAKARIDAELGVLCWPNGVDIDAELLRYDDLWRQQTELADPL